MAGAWSTSGGREIHHHWCKTCLELEPVFINNDQAQLDMNNVQVFLTDTRRDCTTEVGT